MDVTLDGVHFVGQSTSAVTIAAAANAVVSRCVIDGVIPSLDPLLNLSVSWGINVSRPPMGTAVIDSLDIERNVVDMLATSTDNTLGIFVAGSVDAASIDRNVVRNATAHAIDVRGFGDGVNADIERNDVAVMASERSGISMPPNDRLITGIRVSGTGSYSVLSQRCSHRTPERGRAFVANDNRHDRGEQQHRDGAAAPDDSRIAECRRPDHPQDDGRPYLPEHGCRHCEDRCVGVDRGGRQRHRFGPTILVSRRRSPTSRSTLGYRYAESSANPERSSTREPARSSRRTRPDPDYCAS
jgi:hypothetical protein